MTDRQVACVLTVGGAVVLALSPLFPWYYPFSFSGSDTALTGYEIFETRDIVITALGGLAAMFSVAGLVAGRPMFLLAGLTALGATAVALYSLVVLPDIGFRDLKADSVSWGGVVAVIAGVVALVGAAGGASLDSESG